ncbi:MAG TPA: phosphate signaling complex protein PhoU [Chitinophagaceae bacterium]|jgi:phosphate transport system protein
MAQIEGELLLLKAEVMNMWNLVLSQMTNTRLAFLNIDKDLAREVVLKEKRVNGMELKIDRDCENIFALYCPVAIDLRFLLAALKINSNLERIGDIAEGVAKYLIDAESPFSNELLELTGILPMYEEAINMLVDCQDAFETENTILARSIFKRDDLLDKVNKKSIKVLEKYVKEHPDNTAEGLWILSIIRKLERVGDQTKNIAEEIIFYLEAKVLKHKNKHV